MAAPSSRLLFKSTVSYTRITIFVEEIPQLGFRDRVGCAFPATPCGVGAWQRRQGFICNSKVPVIIRGGRNYKVTPVYFRYHYSVAVERMRSTKRLMRFIHYSIYAKVEYIQVDSLPHPGRIVFPAQCLRFPVSNQCNIQLKFHQTSTSSYSDC